MKFLNCIHCGTYKELFEGFSANEYQMMEWDFEDEHKSCLKTRIKSAVNLCQNSTFTGITIPSSTGSIDLLGF